MQRPDPRRPSCPAEPCAGRQIGAGAGGAGPLTSGDRILGAVLAGGRSSRFGSDKAAALLRGRALAAHAAAALAPHVGAVVTIGREDDRPAPDLGPLGGIAGALLRADAGAYASVLTIGCDMPVVPDALLAALAGSLPSFCGDAPVLGHWPASLGRALAARLATDDDRSVRRWAAAIGATMIAAPAPLANINTPADLRAL